MLLMLMLGQAISNLPPIEFDLAKVEPPTATCSTPGIDDIVVCAKRRSPRADRADSGPVVIDALPKAEIGLFGDVRGGVGVQRGAVGGFPSNRVMATITVPF